MTGLPPIRESRLCWRAPIETAARPSAPPATREPDPRAGRRNAERRAKAFATGRPAAGLDGQREGRGSRGQTATALIRLTGRLRSRCGHFVLRAQRDDSATKGLSRLSILLIGRLR